jgi:hypothetical protein
MRTLAIVLGLTVGCGGGKADKFDEILAQLEKFKIEMCACKDVACADRVLDARRDYRKTMRDSLDKNAKPSDAQDAKGKAFESELQACRKKLTGPAGGSGSSAGAAEEPEKSSTD